MKILICGGRDFNDRDRAFKELDAAHAELNITLVIEGGARGGFRRNLEMLDEKPDGVIAFPGGNGTAHTVRNAKQRGIPVLEL